ncbi:MAG: DUF2203 domain-containing protein [Actinomycetota bacterium]
MTERRFTVAEAEVALAAIRPRLPDIRDARRTMLETAERVRGAVESDGGGHHPGAGYRSAQQLLAREVEKVAREGVLLRDVDPALLDFPAERDGEAVFLCWREPEPAIAWWHPVDAGFGGRRPL